MKTKKLVVTIFAVGMALATFAINKPKMNVHPLNANHVLVAVKADEAVDMEVSISDDIEGVIYYKRSQKPVDSFHKVFDVKDLPNGEYKMVVKLGNLINERELVVSSDKILVQNEKEYPAPYFEFNGTNLVITHLNFEKAGYFVTIYDDNGAVFRSSLENRIPINSGFDLTRLEAGNYNVVLSSDEHEYKYSFKK